MFYIINVHSTYAQKNKTKKIKQKERGGGSKNHHLRISIRVFSESLSF